MGKQIKDCFKNTSRTSKRKPLCRDECQQIYQSLHSRIRDLTASSPSLRRFLRAALTGIFSLRLSSIDFLQSIQNRDNFKDESSPELLALIKDMYMLCVDRVVSDLGEAEELEDLMQDIQKDAELQNHLVRLARMIHRQRYNNVLARLLPLGQQDQSVQQLWN